MDKYLKSGMSRVSGGYTFKVQDDKDLRSSHNDRRQIEDEFWRQQIEEHKARDNNNNNNNNISRSIDNHNNNGLNSSRLIRSSTTPLPLAVTSYSYNNQGLQSRPKAARPVEEIEEIEDENDVATDIDDNSDNELPVVDSITEQARKISASTQTNFRKRLPIIRESIPSPKDSGIFYETSTHRLNETKYITSNGRVYKFKESKKIEPEINEIKKSVVSTTAALVSRTFNKPAQLDKWQPIPTFVPLRPTNPILSSGQFLGPVGNRDLKPLLTTNQFLGPVGNRDLRPLLTTNQFLGPVGNRDLRPLLTTNQFLGPVGNRDLRPLLTTTQVLAPVGNRDLKPLLSTQVINTSALKQSTVLINVNPIEKRSAVLLEEPEIKTRLVKEKSPKVATKLAPIDETLSLIEDNEEVVVNNKNEQSSSIEEPSITDQERELLKSTQLVGKRPPIKHFVDNSRKEKVQRQELIIQRLKKDHSKVVEKIEPKKQQPVVQAAPKNEIRYIISNDRVYKVREPQTAIKHLKSNKQLNQVTADDSQSLSTLPIVINVNTIKYELSNGSSNNKKPQQLKPHSHPVAAAAYRNSVILINTNKPTSASSSKRTSQQPHQYKQYEIRYI